MRVFIHVDPLPAQELVRNLCEPRIHMVDEQRKTLLQRSPIFSLRLSILFLLSISSAPSPISTAGE